MPPHLPGPTVAKRHTYYRLCSTVNTNSLSKMFSKEMAFSFHAESAWCERTSENTWLLPGPPCVATINQTPRGGSVVSTIYATDQQCG